MGTLTGEIAANILRGVLLAQLQAKERYQEDLAARANNPPTWNWPAGTYVFPEGVCCYCGGVMRSSAIWRTKDLQFLGSWKVVGNGDGVGLLTFDGSHPHVNAGSICMGNGTYRASSVGDALFMGFNPLSMYFSGEDHLKAWFADRFDHRCELATGTRTIGGTDTSHAVAAVKDCHCPFCRMHRGEVQCPRGQCRQWYPAEVGHGRYRCETCDPKLHFCIKHKHDKRRCADCWATHDLYNVELGAMDPSPKVKECEECHQQVCWLCLGEGDSEPRHKCARLAAGLSEVVELLDEDSAEEACDHSCCSDCCSANDCDRCDYCDEYPPSCEC